MPLISLLTAQAIGSLLEIRVNNNGFSAEGAVAFAEAVAHNAGLKVCVTPLHFTKNHIPSCSVQFVGWRVPGGE